MIVGPTRSLPSESPRLIERYATTAPLQPKPIMVNGELHCLPTANLAIRRDWFDKVGGFDERFNGGEDTNLTYRLKKAGAPIHIDWSWFTHHDPEWSLGGFCERWYRYGRGVGQHKWLTGGESFADLTPPSSVWLILRSLPKMIGDIRMRYHGSGLSGYRRLLYVALDLLRQFLFQLGVMRGYERAARTGGGSGPSPGG